MIERLERNIKKKPEKRIEISSEPEIKETDMVSSTTLTHRVIHKTNDEEADKNDEDDLS